MPAPLDSLHEILEEHLMATHPALEMVDPRPVSEENAPKARHGPIDFRLLMAEQRFLAGQGRHDYVIRHINHRSILNEHMFDA
jgi:hypothetical protein